MSTENEVETPEPTLRETLEAAVAEHADPVETPDVTVVDKTEKPMEGRNEQGRFKPKEEPQAIVAPVIAPKDAPTHWKAEAKEKFKDLNPEMQDVILNREKEMEVIASRVDDERRLGKDLKEVITPYMAVIQAEGGTPQGAVKDLLNTAYILRTGSPQQKAQIVAAVIQQYGVDPRLLNQPQNFMPQVMQQPVINKEQIKQELMKELQEQNEAVKVNSEIQTFAADPQNVHFSNPQVKALMSSLLGSGQAKDLQDAYSQATWAVPDIRQKLLDAQQADQEAKRKEELVAKRKAGSSVSGSPGISVPNTGTPDRSLREEIAANMASLRH